MVLKIPHGFRRISLAVTVAVRDVGLEAADNSRLVVIAASLGTVFEWYDFFLYGSLAVFFSGLFFPPGNETACLSRESRDVQSPALPCDHSARSVFGALADRIGRKRCFAVITMVMMGLSTVVVGLLPSYAQVGVWAPVLLVLLRLTQGLAVGGEYGSAATYVAEHAPADAPRLLHELVADDLSS